jgi:hypothetical protein
VGAHSVVFEPQDALKLWLCPKIRYVPTPNMTCVGLYSHEDKDLKWVVGYDQWSQNSAEMHVAGDGFVSREFLYKVFAYPFSHAGIKVLLGRVSSNNEDALKLNKHLGFERVCTIPDAADDGDLVIMAMRREDCRWLKLQGRKFAA